MRPGECPQTDTHTHTHGQTQNDFIICPMLYAIAMGQIINVGVRQVAHYSYIRVTNTQTQTLAIGRIYAMHARRPNNSLVLTVIIIIIIRCRPNGT